MNCIICGVEIEEGFRNTCDKCEKEVEELSQKILEPRKKINFAKLKREEYSQV
ncbi:hypothetical protein [Fuchsiella alkaliacetigena]|uniref:hypothetical protein n=1 Tax=Fuchsiella alkaliacetigena TaxID=957042 RepID=UPI00200AF3FF|nr:hypothetical protein [Fuchsiella alkaliacetigena]MCK8824781.1 hypothetical protein [Fuchsiella alkaliacetigena]